MFPSPPNMPPLSDHCTFSLFDSWGVVKRQVDGHRAMIGNRFRRSIVKVSESGDYVGFLSNCRLCSCSWFDVVIHAEEVCRIVFVFENHKTIIL